MFRLESKFMTPLTSRNTTLPESECAQPTKQQIRVPPFIDAPEKGQAFGQRAKQAMSELIFGKDVKLLPHTIDRYVRLVAQVFVGNQDAGLELLKQGLCWVYEKYAGEASGENSSRLPRCSSCRTIRKAWVVAGSGPGVAVAVEKGRKGTLKHSTGNDLIWPLPLVSWIEPLLESSLEALAHLFFDVFDVTELTPTSHIAVFGRPSISTMNSSTKASLSGYFCRRRCLQSSAVCFWRFLVPILICAPQSLNLFRKPSAEF
jgi:hypothetical protein